MYIALHGTALHVSICKGPSSGNQTNAIPHKIKSTTLIHSWLFAPRQFCMKVTNLVLWSIALVPCWWSLADRNAQDCSVWYYNINIKRAIFFEGINVFPQSVQPSIQCVPVNLAADKTSGAWICLSLCRKGKGKSIPIQAWTGSKVSMWLRMPDFKIIGTGRR